MMTGDTVSMRRQIDDLSRKIEELRRQVSGVPVRYGLGGVSQPSVVAPYVVVSASAGTCRLIRWNGSDWESGGSPITFMPWPGTDLSDYSGEYEFGAGTNIAGNLGIYAFAGLTLGEGVVTLFAPIKVNGAEFLPGGVDLSA